MAYPEDLLGDYDPNRQVGTATNPLSTSATYTPPGEQAPIDQYNWTPDPSAPGGFSSAGPGVAGPLDQPNFSTPTNQPPDASQMAQAAASAIDLTPTVTASGEAQIAPTTNTGWDSVSPQDQATWNSQYGQNAGQYQYAIQNGGQGNPAGFNALPLNEQNIWYGTYGANAPQVWQQQSAGAAAANAPPAAGSQTPASSASAPAGPIGYNNWGMSPVNIIPGYTPYLANQAAAPGYIPGSGSYNQWNLDDPGLFGQIAGQASNMQYGSGSIGDPTNGTQQQTPEAWTKGPQAFQWDGNMENELGYIANLFGRSDPSVPSGIGTATWSAPKQYWDGLAQQVAAGRVKPTNFGWAALAAKGYTPQSIGGGAVQQAAGVGVQANGTGAQGPGAGAAGGSTGPMGAGTAGFNAAYATNQTNIRGQDLHYAYLNERMRMLEIPEMQNKTALELDKLAFDKVKQQYLEQYQASQAAEAKRQFDVLDTSRVAQLTGQYGGQDTMAMQAQKQNQTMQYLQMLGSLRGPADIFQYMKVLNGTPGGMRDVVNAAAGQYAMPSFGGGATVGGGQVGGGSADINSLLGQMNTPGYGQAETSNLNLPPPNQINALSLQRMTPTQQQTLLAAYESAGYRPEDVMAIFRNSLPSYGASGGGGSPASSGQVNLFGR